jgi:hypothetical protein
MPHVTPWYYNFGFYLVFLLFVIHELSDAVWYVLLNCLSQSASATVVIVFPWQPKGIITIIIFSLILAAEREVVPKDR